MSAEQRAKIGRPKPIPAEKRCCVCKVVRPAEQFGFRAGKRWLRAICRPCEAERSRRRYHADPERAAATFRRWMLKARHDLTEAEYFDLLDRQGGACAICGATEADRNRPLLHVDHDHETGNVRGLLCTPCNAGIGHFRDDPALLRRAIRYLGGGR
jgi:hypothetical protein